MFLTILSLLYNSNEISVRDLCCFRRNISIPTVIYVIYGLHEMFYPSIHLILIKRIPSFILLYSTKRGYLRSCSLKYRMGDCIRSGTSRTPTVINYKQNNGHLQSTLFKFKLVLDFKVL